MLSVYVFVCENVCESSLTSIVCLFSIFVANQIEQREREREMKKKIHRHTGS